MQKLTNNDIEGILSTYKEEYKLVKDITYSHGSIEAELIPFIYPFTKTDSGYVNNTQLNLYLSQLAYIVVSTSVRDKSFTALATHITPDSLKARIIERTVYFTSIALTMKKVIFKKNMPFRAKMKIKAVRKVSGRIFITIEFDLGKGACTGELRGVY